MFWTEFPDASGSRAIQHNMPWSQVVTALQRTGPFDRKAECPWLKLATFGDKRTPKGSLRNNSNLMFVTGVEGDYDGGEVTPEQAVAMLEKHGIAAVVYTSPSHTPERPRWRVLCPLSKAHQPEDRERLLARVNGALGGILAPESFTLSQSYYFGRVGDAYEVLTTFDDPEGGSCVDELDELDAIAVGRKLNGNGKTHGPDGDKPLPVWGQAQAMVEELGRKLRTGDNRRELLKGYVASLAHRGLTGAEMRAMVRHFVSEFFDADDPVDERDVAKLCGWGAENVQQDQTTPQPQGSSTSGDIDVESDDSLAIAFALRNPYLRYTEERGKWFRWDGARWQVDSTGHTYHAVRLLLREAEPTENRSGASLRSAQRVAAVEKLARCDRSLAAEMGQWDADDWALNTPTGIINLRDGSMTEHLPEAYHTKITGAGPGGDCPRWNQFLLEVANGDVEVVRFLQRMAGYALTGSVREHVLFFLYGTGRNGKGVFLNTLTKLFGDYARVASMDTFTQSQSDRHPTDLAALHGARLVVAQETEEGRRWAENRIKALTGGDPIAARFMRQDFFTFDPKFKLIIAGNHKPNLRNVDEAMRARLNLVPFTVTIPAEQRDPQLEEKLRAEWPGIMRWCVEGCRMYLEEGLNPPEAVRQATADYFAGQDLFSEWITDCCETGQGYWEAPSRLFSSWTAFAERNNERPGQQKVFRERMEGRGFHQGKDNVRGRYWVGVKVRDEHPQPPHWAD